LASPSSIAKPASSSMRQFLRRLALVAVALR
jgi:hypothetical protein